MNGKRYRVVQWATGNIGMQALKAVIGHPDLELVGVYVHSKTKTGRDAGELCGLAAIGVKASNSIEEILALRADCVLYMPQMCNFAEVCKMLAAGCNVVTTRGEFNNPNRLAPAMRARLEEACRAGNSSIHGTGSSPGFITEALPLVLTSIQRRLDHLLIEEFADLSSRNSPELLFGLMGFAGPPKKDEWRVPYLRESFGPSLQLVAEALGLGFDSIEAEGEVALARRDVSIAAGPLAAGTVAAQRTTVRGMRQGKPLITFTANWYCTTELEPSWDLRPTGWHLLVEGDTPLDVAIGFPVPKERWALVSPGLTAHRAVNAIPYVCEAAPGLRSTVDLPQFIARLGGAAA